MRLEKRAILRFLTEKGVPIQYRQLLKVFGMSRLERTRLEALLDDMVDEGEIARLSGRFYSAMNAQGAIRGKLVCHRDGYGFVVPEGGGEDLYIPARHLRDCLNGDTVEAHVVSSRRDGRRQGRISRVVERGVTTVVGRYQALGRGGYVTPDDERLGHDIIIPPGSAMDARTGQVVVAKIVNYPSQHSGAAGMVTEIIGDANDPEVEVMTVVRKFELPYQFSAAVLAEAAAVPQGVEDDALQGRLDLRNLQTVTIDGETARDFDDAVSVQREGDKFRLWVSIADVSHYVREGSELDGAAYERGTSVYFPDRCIPMLPEALSNGICSLNPSVDRLAMTAEMVFDSGANPVASSFYPSVIRSDARLTYTVVRRILVDGDQEAAESHRELVPMLSVMEDLAGRLRERRAARGSIDFDLPEPQIIIDLQGTTTDIVRAERNLAHRIIEEFMLAANEAVASFLEGSSAPSLYRVHENPDPLKLKDLSEFVFSFGHVLPVVEDRVSPKALQKLLADVEGKPEERLINEVLLRCMKQARYSAENLGHFGLASKSYTHFTSPIRRYPDLIVHRLLKRMLGQGVKEGEREGLYARLTENAAHTSRRERVAMEAEREMVELKRVQFMKDKVGEEFEGYITGVAPFGIFVELIDLFVEGMIPVPSLPPDFYQHLEKSHALVGEHTRVMYRIADKVRVRVAAVKELSRQVEFALVEAQSSGLAPRVRVAQEYGRVPVKGKRPAALKGKRAGASEGRRPQSENGKDARASHGRQTKASGGKHAKRRRR